MIRTFSIVQKLALGWLVALILAALLADFMASTSFFSKGLVSAYASTLILFFGAPIVSKASRILIALPLESSPLTSLFWDKQSSNCSLDS